MILISILYLLGSYCSKDPLCLAESGIWALWENGQQRPWKRSGIKNRTHRDLNEWKISLEQYFSKCGPWTPSNSIN